MKNATALDQRKRTLAAIHAAKHKLGLDDDVYRALVARVSAANGIEQRSAADCTPRQLFAVADELRRLGGMPAKAYGRKPKQPALNRDALMKKIEALLADQGRSWEYGHALAKKIGHVEALEFCTPKMLKGIVAALEYDVRRHPERSRTGYKPEP
jgi:phage gp16-like protein